ncbi:hypothetical protein TorRG33x02_350640 [Trema orientale]|uniref:Uncharacterized protein n=1 Tax=Trema orientale TaxID=63057 RepID=A0A2P5AH19_TREOI|nr:hypothetical protein TorRG33x02_350640 [Trema orientale]
MDERKLSSANCGGISPESLSKDSSVDMFPSDGGIGPVRALFERLREKRPCRSPTQSGIRPSKRLLERSMAVRKVQNGQLGQVCNRIWDLTTYVHVVKIQDSEFC